jgi:hypothetical protein
MKKSARMFDNLLKKIGLPYMLYFFSEFASDMSFSLLFVNPNAWLPLECQKQRQLHDIIKAIENLTKYYQKNQYNIKVSIATFMLFHEIGHLLSAENLTSLELKTELAEYHKKTAIIQKMSISSYDKLVVYKNLYLEKIADKLGYEYYKKYEKEAIEFDKKIPALIIQDFEG